MMGSEDGAIATFISYAARLRVVAVCARSAQQDKGFEMHTRQRAWPGAAAGLWMAIGFRWTRLAAGDDLLQGCERVLGARRRY
jgi:hypothetical protein